jgi:phosphoglycerate kinase
VHQLARLGDCYVNDAFGTAHRAHASTALIAQYFPGRAAAGFLLQKEIRFIGEALLEPKRPFVAIVGGAKISTKLGVIHALLQKVDTLLIGGGMAYTFFKAQGIAIGNSLCEEEMLSEAKKILAYADEHPGKLFLPVDNRIADAFDAAANTHIIESTQGIPEGWEGVDIGPRTVELFSAELQRAATVFWNGPLGVFEIPPFANGTIAIAKVVAHLQAITIVGGGDSVAALQKSKLADSITHLSTGGGATLEYIEYGTLPGIEALSDQPPEPK